MIYSALTIISAAGLLILLYLLRRIIDFRALLITILLITSLFTTLDYFMIGRAWNFNSIYISGIFILNIPIEEILFFAFIPPVVYFMSTYMPNSKYLRYLNTLLVITFLSIILIYGKGIYSTLMLVLGIIMLLIYANTEGIDRGITLGFILFIPYNLYLTYLPVVVYYPNSVSGIRFLSIPIEDFVFNFVMLSIFAIIYNHLKKQDLDK